VITPLIAEDPRPFVRTVLLVDDKALEEDKNDGGDADQDSHAVDTRAIIDGLADGGLSCTVLAPGGHGADDQDRQRVIRMARAADIVILDWTIPNLGGELGTGKGNALPLIEAIIDADREDGGRLRYIAVYTGEADLADKAEDIGGLLRDRSIDFEQRDLTLAGEELRIALIAKPGSADEAVEKVTGAQLADRLPKQFVEAFANGLLRRVALASVSVLRTQIHRILTKFPPELDRAFLSHRAMTSAVAGEDFARQLVADELTAALAGAAVEKWVYEEKVEARVNELLVDGAERRAINKSGTGLANPYVPDDAFRSALVRPDDAAPMKDGRKIRNAGSLTSCFDPSEDTDAVLRQAKDIDMAFTVLATFSLTSTDVLNVPWEPRLQLGTILQDSSDGTYLLCMQPLCDGVRIKHDEQRAFPFLPLKPPGDSVHIVLEIGPQSYGTLTTDFALRDVVIYKFGATNSGYATTTKNEDGSRWFTASEARTDPDQKDEPAPTKQLRWMGQLRLDQAHRFAVRLGANTGRIGLDEPEWSRKLSGDRSDES
jgi:Response receiver domain